eukprot:2715982-Prymnesium_polylepis.1
MPPHPRNGRTLLGHLGGGTHTPPRPTFGVADTVFDCGSGVVRWCAHHLQHLGSPWGIEILAIPVHLLSLRGGAQVSCHPWGVKALPPTHCPQRLGCEGIAPNAWGVKALPPKTCTAVCGCPDWGLVERCP